jgi:hypothetical protein
MRFDEDEDFDEAQRRIPESARAGQAQPRAGLPLSENIHPNVRNRSCGRTSMCLCARSVEICA